MNELPPAAERLTVARHLTCSACGAPPEMRDVDHIMQILAEARVQGAREERERREIETNARLSDALDALRAAVLWLHGEYRFRTRSGARSEFNGDAWYRKARSGIVGLHALLAEPTVDDPSEEAK